MTRDEFRQWVALYRRMPESACRRMADSIRPHDPVLADLYERRWQAHEAIRARVRGRVA